ncbi:MAG: peptide chain release factor N(5)-glutamine methyltransferase [Wenzhouxiangella sp.]|nr:MAG: peptide chain release factor N(5)-glutamine methyltransferase [Wenzhouxiangella sp.]
MTVDARLTVQAHLRQAASKLDSRLEAEVLLACVLGKNRTWLYAHTGQTLDPVSSVFFEQLVERRRCGEPVAYLIGKREFYGRDFAVNPDVLIPRPETELLVDRALALPLPSNACVVDVGTGSGCIALTLAAERSNWQVLATDVSPQALTVARANQETLGLAGVSLLQSDLLAAVLHHRFDLIVSNPPYVAEGDPHLDRGDLRFEPSIALSCEDDGLALIVRLTDQASAILKPGGWLAIEHGHDQGKAVAALFGRAGLVQIETCNDLAGLPRLTLGQQQ